VHLRHRTPLSPPRIDSLADIPPDVSTAEKIELRGHAITRMRERCDQRDIRVQTNNTRYRLTLERRRLQREMAEAAREAAQEEAWLRAEAEGMLAAGWNREELREIGFAEALLREIGPCPDEERQGNGPPTG
jgi:hypothetical protein